MHVSLGVSTFYCGCDCDRLTNRTTIKVKSLSQFAQDCRKWIKADLELVYDKHVSNTKGVPVEVVWKFW